MNPYQNYSMNNYPQYQQPMYQQMQQPYMDRLQQLQNMQQQLNPPQIQPVQQMQQVFQGLNGRIVDDFNVITANDVPMDGNGAIFVKNDGSEIQVRNWTAQGTIHTSVFKPVLVDSNTNSQVGKEKVEMSLSEDSKAMLKTYFDKINDRLDDLEKALSPLD